MPSRMKKILNLKRLATGSRTRDAADNSEPEDFASDSPEARIKSAIDGFCATGGPHGSGDEVTFLPSVVELAESSPGAASEAAKRIRKHMRTSNSVKPYTQYNAVMLMRILSDNPGKIFTRNLGSTKFVAAVTQLWRDGRDPSVRQLLGETLEHFSTQKKDHDGLHPVILFWTQEKGMMSSPYRSTPPGGGVFPVALRQQQHRPARLPPMNEMVTRISEAQSSAKLLHQVLTNTPKTDVPNNELVKEFVHRCKNASDSMHAYISADEPIEENLLTTLIETNELLGIALARHRGVLEAVELGREMPQDLPGARPPAPPPKPPHREYDTDVPALNLPPPLSLPNTADTIAPKSTLREPFDDRDPFADDNGEGSSTAFHYDSDEEQRRIEIREGKKPIPISLQAGVDDRDRERISEQERSLVSPVSPVSGGGTLENRLVSPDAAEPMMPAMHGARKEY